MYRDDLEAARARLRAAERENADLRARAAEAARAPAGEPVRPAGFAVTEELGALSIGWRWRGEETLGLGFAVAVASFAMLATVPRRDPLVIFIATAALGAALVCGYALLVRAVNRIEVRAGAGVLAVRHGPLPWPGAQTPESRDVAQLYAIEPFVGDRRRTRGPCDVHAIDRSSRRTRIASGLALGEALFLERAVERKLGIVEVPVEGEVGRAEEPR